MSLAISTDHVVKEIEIEVDQSPTFRNSSEETGLGVIGTALQTTGSEEKSKGALKTRMGKVLSTKFIRKTFYSGLIFLLQLVALIFAALASTTVLAYLSVASYLLAHFLIWSRKAKSFGPVKIKLFDVVPKGKKLLSRKN